ncbi:uncharacterized protein LOC116301193 isoform X2 [Actinia tenebrosa]|uniref:Uncharacterized protein LOC116301193 isoform X2 n=1 Tax=Actinia tenebrosa TaxID=6105 RepID=A0A6P8IH76_ACTTE|nr:uncharacterized protein LOC116301193 isoform X2 [Actinia tenebrosa]
MAKHYASGLGHVFLVRRQSYIPTYFSIHEFQLVQNTSDSEFLSETPASVEDNTEYDFEDYAARLLPDQGTLKSQLSTSSEYSLSWLQNLAELETQSATPTTRLRSSGLAKLFSCNVSKMSYETKSKLECDGYFGCPEEKHLAKENATFPRRRHPVCIIPWKKRQPSVKTSRKKKTTTKQTKPKPPTRSDSMDAYYVTKVDCVTSTLEKSKVNGIKLRIRPKIPLQSQSTKSHPAMFYSYFVSKGCQYRKACAPKRRSCDGFFGCHDGEDTKECKGECKGKRKGKKKQSNK